ncbi:unnamed protein product [Phytophthora lilii]|uniref:Unnamed protein product n=1 Tax=Phytophthora lilii TaxID=2077276 RepID=A0A9W6XAY1_9STRA|nr:unnamed protein product [Phytophthora lilii]
MEDDKASFNLFGCVNGVYGIGTLSMPGNFPRVGPALGIVGMAFMAFANACGATAICRVMLLAPTSVKTCGDLGGWVLGKHGRYLTVVVQMISCLIVPCVFLVLGSTILNNLFPNAFNTVTWSILAALTVTLYVSYQFSRKKLEPHLQAAWGRWWQMLLALVLW